MGAVTYGLNEIKAADQAALQTKLAQIQLMAETNKEAFAELATKSDRGRDRRGDRPQRTARAWPKMLARDSLRWRARWTRRKINPSSGLIFISKCRNQSPRKFVEEWRTLSIPQDLSGK